MSVLKKLAGETAWYGVSTILGRLLNYLLVPLHTAVFARPAELAIIVKLYAIIAFLNIIYTYGLETAYFRFATKYDEKDYFNASLSAILLSSLFFSGILLLFAPPLAVFLGAPGQGKLITWTAFILAIDALVAIPFARLRLQKKPRQFALAKIINIGLNVGLNVFFLWFCKRIYEGQLLPEFKPLIATIYNPELGVGYIVFANLLANASLLLLLRGSFAGFRFTLQKTQLQSLLQYGYPILIMGLAGTVNLMFDRLMLERLLPEGFYPGRTSEDALGIYGNCYKLSIFISLAVQAFKYAAEPFFFSRAEDKNAPGVFADVMKWFVIVCGVIWLAVSVNLDIIGNVFLRSSIYREGLAVVPVLLLANLFLGVYYNLSVWFKLTDRTYFGTWITFMGAAVVVAGNLLLIPAIGYMGCAVAFLLSCVTMTAVCYALGNKYFPVPYHVKSALFYLGSAAALIFIASQVSIENQVLATGFHLVLCVIYLLAIFLMEKPRFSRPKTA